MDKESKSQADSGNLLENLLEFENLPRENQKKVISKVFFLIIGVILAAFLFFNSFYTLTEDMTAVVCTFGKPASVTKTGPHFKIPFVQTVYKMSKEIRGMRIGYDENNESTVSESEMITKDFNFVNVDFYVEYQVVDPARAYIYRDNAVDILENLAQSYIRDTVGIYSVDEVITTGKAEIQAKVKLQLSERLEKEDIGIGVNNVTIQDSEPPTIAVSDAFKAVEDAKQSMDTKINEAKKYQSEQIPAANSRADKAKKDAEAYKQQRISEAEGQVSRFNDMYEEYIKYPLITKKRMFYETMENVLPSLKVIIDGSDGTQTILPLEPFMGSEKGEQ
jgi:membrane protease subunit HflK